MIPLTKDFSISSNAVSPAGTGVDANGLMLTTSQAIPSAVVQYYPTAKDIADVFGYDSDEYECASVYFSGFTGAAQLPAELRVVGIPAAATAGGLYSGSNAAVTMPEINALEAGTIKITVDGNTQTSSNIDLTTAQSQSDVATALQAALTGVTVAWNATAAQYAIKSATTGESSSVGYASGKIATALKLTQAGGAKSSSGTGTMTLAQVMDHVVDTDQNWFGFASAQALTNEQQLELAKWGAGQDAGNRYLFAASLSNGVESTLFDECTQNNYGGVFIMRGEPKNAFSVIAWAAGLDFTATNGRVSYKFRQFTGMSDQVDSLKVANALEAAGVNYYGNYSSNKVLKNYAATGVITGQFKWVDTFLDQVWLKANLISAFANLFTNNQSYSFTEAGYTAVKAAAQDPLQQAINFGAIRKGVTLDQSQIQIINQQVGKDISGSLFSDGYYFHIPNQPGSNRIERTLKGAVLFWTDGQLIQSLNLQSTTVL